jgi:hypothetical protein
MNVQATESKSAISFIRFVLIVLKGSSPFPKLTQGKAY